MVEKAPQKPKRETFKLPRATLAKQVDSDLMERWKNYLGDNSMQTALITITQVRRLGEIARVARAENEEIQSNRKGT